jgi:phosphotriesterase-related protein
MGTYIDTVAGPVAPDDLGITSMHEHIPLDRAGSFRQDAFDFAVAELTKARELGLTTLVEVSPARDMRGLRDIAAKSGINIVACTGFYHYSEREKRFSEEEFYRHMMMEIDLGIDGTGIRPGVLKIKAESPDLTAHETRAVTAAARAQAKSGLPLCTHAVSGCARQQEVLEAGGADLAKVYFSHTEAEFGWEGRDLEHEIEYLLDVVAKGSTLSYNNFGNWAHTKPESLLAIITALIESGYSDNQIATMDVVWSYDKTSNRRILWSDINTDGPRRAYSYLLSDAVPWMQAGGISDADIRRMIEHTPKRLLGRV